MRYTVGSICLILTLTTSSFGRPPYMEIIESMELRTEREKKVYASIDAYSCNTCHVDKRPKRVRNLYGTAFYNAVGGPQYRYRKLDWIDRDGHIEPDAERAIREVIKLITK